MIQVAIHFVRILGNLLGQVVDDCNDTIDEIEDLVLKRSFSTQRSKLGQLRQLLARLCRYLRANRHALLQMVTGLPNWCSQQDEGLLRQYLEKWDSLLQDLELVQERSRLLQEELAGQREEAINRNLYVLSIVTTVSLPITLITSIFRMNVGGLPWTDTSMGFIGVSFIMLLTLSVTLLVLRQQRFL